MAPWEEHRLEAYATLAPRSVKQEHESRSHNGGRQNGPEHWQGAVMLIWVSRYYWPTLEDKDTSAKCSPCRIESNGGAHSL